AGEITGLGNRVNGCGERFDECGLKIGDPLGDPVHAAGGDREQIGHTAGRLAAEHLQVTADVVAPGPALGAPAAIQVRFDDHAGAGGEVGRIRPGGGDHTDHLV